MTSKAKQSGMTQDELQQAGVELANIYIQRTTLEREEKRLKELIKRSIKVDEKLSVQVSTGETLVIEKEIRRSINTKDEALRAWLQKSKFWDEVSEEQIVLEKLKAQLALNPEIEDHLTYTETQAIKIQPPAAPKTKE